jgi:hypothetical protein
MALLALVFTAKSSIHPSIPMVLFGVFFGFEYVLVFLAMILYLSDTYFVQALPMLL